MESERFKKGMEVLERINPGNGRRIFEKFSEISPDMARFIVEFPYGDVYSRPQLDLKTREFIAVTILATLGHLPQLKAHIRNALALGIKQEQVIEVLIELAVYAGFPSALNGLLAAKDVFDERKA